MSFMQGFEESPGCDRRDGKDREWLPVAFYAYALFCLFKAIGPIKECNRIVAASKPEEPTLRQA